MLVLGMILTALAVGGMIGWSLHEIRRVDRIIAGDERGTDGEG